MGDGRMYGRLKGNREGLTDPVIVFRASHIHYAPGCALAQPRTISQSAPRLVCLAWCPPGTIHGGLITVHRHHDGLQLRQSLKLETYRFLASKGRGFMKDFVGEGMSTIGWIQRPTYLSLIEDLIRRPNLVPVGEMNGKSSQSTQNMELYIQ